MNQTVFFIVRNTRDTIETNVPAVAINSPLNKLFWFEIVIGSLTYGLGFLGNFFALIVFSSLTELRKISTGIFFLLMTISNIFHLSTLTIEFLSICGYHIYLYCRWNFFLQNLTRAMSTYFSVSIAIDRFIRSEIPLRSWMICTRKNAFIITIIIFIVFSLFWSFYLLPFSSQNPINGVCIYNQSASYDFFLIYVNIPLRAVLLCLIPIIIMIATNIRIMNNIRLAHNRIGDIPKMNEGNKGSTITLSATITGPGYRRTLAIDRMLFYMMLASVLTFIITQIPFHIYMVVRVYVHTFDAYTHLLIYAMLLIWSSVYFGIAFYLYCLASPLFRRKFIKIIKKIIHCHMLRCLTT